MEPTCVTKCCFHFRKGCIHVIPQGGSVKSSLALSARQRRDSLIGSARMTFPPLASFFLPCCPPLLQSVLVLLALGGTQEPLRPLGRVTGTTGPLLTCFNNFLPSSVKLCKYFSPVSLSLECQLRVSVWFS